MATQLSESVIEVNNESIGIVPNTLMFTEGLGEQTVLPVSEGGGRVSQVYANDLETAFARVSFSMRTTVDNVEAVRQWKVNKNRNVVIVAADDGEGNDLIRTFTQASLTSDYEVNIQADGVIEVEFQTNSPI